MSRDKDDRRTPALGREPLSELYARHFTEPDIEYQATELWMLLVCEKGFRRVVRNWLKSGRAQEPAE